jgi:glycosyltransferase involved in cell wall biosynthesis
MLVYEPSPITVGVPALVVRALKGTPLLFWVQDLWPESLSATGALRSPPLLRWVERLVRYIYRRCDRILVPSRAFIEPIVRLGINAQRILYLPNTAEALYRPASRTDDPPLAAGLPTGFRVMFAGNIGAAQSFETILAAAERLKSRHGIHWLIVGEGRMQSWVAAEVVRRNLQENVHLLGQHPVHAMPAFFGLADAMLVTLKKDPIFAMTIPTKLQSYLACGKPIVAAIDGEGARVVLEARAGLACPAEEPEALAAAVLAMARLAPEARHEMARRGREYFELHFERAAVLERLEACMNETMIKQCGPCAR